MASTSASSTDATSTTPQSSPDVVPLPRDTVRHELLGVTFFGLSFVTMMLSFCFLSLSPIGKYLGNNWVLLSWLLLFMLWGFGNIMVAGYSKSLRDTEEKAKPPMTCDPDGVTAGDLDFNTRGPIGITAGDERTPFLPFMEHYKRPQNIPQILYVNLHRVPGTEQPISKIMYYHDIGPDGPSEKFMRKAVLVMALVFLPLYNWGMFHECEWPIPIILIVAAFWNGCSLLVWIRYNQSLDTTPRWYEIREVEGPRGNTLSYGATDVTCGHCGQRIENRDNKAGQVVIEQGETPETIV